jgi:hypothetical protein
VFLVCGSLAGSMSTYALGAVGDAYNVKKEPQIIGNVLGSILVGTYLISGILFMISGKLYSNDSRIRTLSQSVILEEDEDLEESFKSGSDYQPR